MLYKAPRTKVTIPQGGFTVNVNFPGYNIPGRADHGYGPLSVVAESLLEPGTWIRLHEHANEEIVSWIPAGVMRHNDQTVGELVADPDQFMIMNAGRSFWHEERTLPDDPHLRMLQIFVRPHTLDLEPGIQHRRIMPSPSNEWRLLFGPEGSDTPFFVRAEVYLYDTRLDEHASAHLPSVTDWDTYFYVFSGAIEVGDTHFNEAESGLLTGESGLKVEAEQDTILVAFLINPNATITRSGTIGR